VLSSPPEATRAPSGLKATAYNLLACRGVARPSAACPRGTDQTCTKDAFRPRRGDRVAERVERGGGVLGRRAATAAVTVLAGRRPADPRTPLRTARTPKVATSAPSALGTTRAAHGVRGWVAAVPAAGGARSVQSRAKPFLVAGQDAAAVGLNARARGEPLCRSTVETGWAVAASQTRAVSSSADGGDPATVGAERRGRPPGCRASICVLTRHPCWRALSQTLGALAVAGGSPMPRPVRTERHPVDPPRASAAVWARAPRQCGRPRPGATPSAPPGGDLPPSAASG